jgi:glucose/arabinose dehydrogenase
MLRTIILFAVFCFLRSGTINAQATVTLDSTVLTEREVAIGIQVPWEILWGPDDFIWATERRGRVLRISPSTGNVATILNIQNLVESGGEPGLLGMVLHPDFANTPKVFLVYNYPGGASGIAERVVTYEWDGTALVSPTIIFDNIPGGGIHNGSRLLITTDNKLLVTTGDTGSGTLSQNMSSLSGKLLRMNLDGSLPADNPIPGSYVYSFGHRNAQGICYGPGGKLYSSEHGAQQDDEFNLIEPNRNYGWPTVQGVCNTNAEITFCNANNVRQPLRTWTPCVAVNGVEYYTHPAIPEWQGKMILSVLGGIGTNLPRISVLELNAAGDSVKSEKQYFANYGRLRDVCFNPYNGALYFATNGPSYPGSGPNRIIEYRNLAYTPSSNTPDIEDASQFIKLSPVPMVVGQQLTAEFSESFLGTDYQVFNFEGKQVLQAKITGTRELVATEHLPKAAYYLTATNARGTISKKFVVQ